MGKVCFKPIPFKPGKRMFFKLNYYILKDCFSFFASLECGGIYKEASHCWPFSNSFSEVVSKDLKGDRQASLKVSGIFL